MLSLEAAPKRDISSLRNWVVGTGCLAREETEYLERESDLLSVASPIDDALGCLEPFVEDIMMRLCTIFGKV